MSKKTPTKLVTKREALKIATKHIERPGVLSLNVLIELLTWQAKLVLWVLNDKAARRQAKRTLWFLKAKAPQQ